MTGRLLAWANLGYRMAAHMLALPFRALRPGRGAARFRAAVVPEGSLPLSAPERAEFPAFMRCINCGLCSLACPALGEAPADAWVEAWTLVVGPSRVLDRAALAALSAGPCARCDACAAVCPTEVPIPRLAALVGALARRGAEED